MARQPIRRLLPQWENSCWRRCADASVLTVAVGRKDHAEQIDDTWPKARSSDALNGHWKWRDIFDRSTVRVVGLIDGDVVFAFGCKRSFVKRGPPKCLVLDYIEVSPLHRGRDWGRLAMGLVAALALDEGCEAVLLGAIPDEKTIAFYVALGASKGELPIPWSTGDKLLVRLYLGRDQLEALEGWTSERRKDI